LRKFVVLEILEEHCGVFDLSGTLRGVGNRVIEDCGADPVVSLTSKVVTLKLKYALVLSNVIIGTILLIDPSKPLEARIRLIFLIKSPADSLVLEQVDDSRYILGNRVESITV
jgi:hypothetical protein